MSTASWTRPMTGTRPYEMSTRKVKKYEPLSVHTMVAYRGSRGTALLFLSLGIKWKWVVNFTPQPFYARETTPVPIKREAGWAPEPVWTILRGRNDLLLAEIRTLDGPARNLMAVTIGQHMFSFHIQPIHRQKTNWSSRICSVYSAKIIRNMYG